MPLRSRVRQAAWAAFAVAIGVLGCSRSSGDPMRSSAVQVAATPAPPRPTEDSTDAPSDGARVLADDAPLESGMVLFEGMVLPTKGGVNVRGVTFSVEALTSLLHPRTLNVDEILGARIRVVAVLQREDGGPEPRGDEAVQRRAGVSYHPRKLISAEIVAEPMQIEGEVHPSKGFYSVGQYLVSRRDLAWAFAGTDVQGERVRLWGQPRIVVCEPQAQCLIGGELPIFEVGRAEIAPGN